MVLSLSGVPIYVPMLWLMLSLCCGMFMCVGTHPPELRASRPRVAISPRVPSLGLLAGVGEGALRPVVGPSPRTALHLRAGRSVMCGPVGEGVLQADDRERKQRRKERRGKIRAGMRISRGWGQCCSVGPPALATHLRGSKICSAPRAPPARRAAPTLNWYMRKSSELNAAASRSNTTSFPDDDDIRSFLSCP